MPPVYLFNVGFFSHTIHCTLKCWAALSLAACGEAIGGSNECFAHARVSRGMARATHHHQFAIWPRLGQFPCSDEWTAQVKASMDQDAGNVGERTRLSQQH